MEACNVHMYKHDLKHEELPKLALYSLNKKYCMKSDYIITVALRAEKQDQSLQLGQGERRMGRISFSLEKPGQLSLKIPKLLDESLLP